MAHTEDQSRDEATDRLRASYVPAAEPFWGEDEKHEVGDPLSQTTVVNQRVLQGRIPSEYRPTDDPFRPRGVMSTAEEVAIDPVPVTEDTPAGRAAGSPDDFALEQAAETAKAERTQKSDKK